MNKYLLKIKNSLSNDGILTQSLLLFILCFGVYSQTLSSGYMLDDYNFLSSTYKNIFNSLDKYFTATTSKHYTPLYYLINMFLFNKFGQTPWVLHLSNIILFYLSCLFMLILFSIITKEQNISFMASLLFCVHPINTFTINYITANFIFTNALFMELSLIFYWIYLNNKPKSKMYYILSIFLFILSLFSFEGAILYSLYLASILYFYKNIKIKETILKIAPFILITFVYLMFWYFFVGKNSGLFNRIVNSGFTLSTSYISILILLKWYILNLFYPNNIVLMYNVDFFNKFPNLYLFSGVLFAAVLFIIFLCIKIKNKIIPFSVTWLFIGFLLVIPAIFSRIYMGFIIEPHWLYFSSMGFFLLISSFLIYLKKRINKKIYYVLIVFLFLFLISFSLRYIKFSKDENTYCKFWLSISPRNPIPMLSLCKINDNKNNFDEALYYCSNVLNFDERFYYHAYANLGNIYNELNDLEKAKYFLKKSIELNPNYSNSSNSLGVVFYKDKDFVNAEEYFSKAIKIDPLFILPRQNLIDLYIIKNNYDKAIMELKKSLDIKLSKKDRLLLMTKLAVLYYKNGFINDSFDLIEDIFREYNDYSSFILLAKAFEIMNLNNMSAELLSKAIEVYPEKKDAYLFLGSLFKKSGKLNQAISIWQKGLKTDPEDSRFKRNIDETKNLIKKLNIE